MEKCVGGLLVYLFLGVFLLTCVKRVCICNYDKNRIATCEKCFLQFKWGYKQKSVPGSPKSYWSLVMV